MPDYRRAREPGGTFFLTLVTCGRAPLFNDSNARRCLHDAVAQVRRDRPFELSAMVLLPEHLHLILTLPADDADFSIRVAAIKARFTRAWLSHPPAGADSEGCGSAGRPIEQPQSRSRQRQGYRGVWQKRFWEHWIRDESDRERSIDYIHFNPVKHGHIACPHAWPWTTFHRFVAERRYDADWRCACAGSTHPPSPPDVPGAEME